MRSLLATHLPPLSRKPESFDPDQSLNRDSVWAYPFGGPHRSENAFQSCLVVRAVRVPERFRGGCSFGVGPGFPFPLSRAAV